MFVSSCLCAGFDFLNRSFSLLDPGWNVECGIYFRERHEKLFAKRVQGCSSVWRLRAVKLNLFPEDMHTHRGAWFKVNTRLYFGLMAARSVAIKRSAFMHQVTDQATYILQYDKRIRKTFLTFSPEVIFKAQEWTSGC